jgi:hypothetical protein
MSWLITILSTWMSSINPWRTLRKGIRPFAVSVKRSPRLTPFVVLSFSHQILQLTQKSIIFQSRRHT